jgi:GNAT superfamily N-acetyltransferase
MERTVDPRIEFSHDRTRVDVARVHTALSQSYWSPGIRRELVEKAIANSLVLGAHLADTQIAFARVVTDGATFAWLCDVWVDEAFRGQGIGKALVARFQAHPELQSLRTWGLGTRDAHGLYAQFGFEPCPANRWMIRRFPDSRWQEPAFSTEKAPPGR